MYNLLIIKGYNFFFKGEGKGFQLKFFCGDHFTIEGHQTVIFWRIELMEPSMDVLSQTLIQVTDSMHLNTENSIRKVHLCLTWVNVFQCILTSNIHINCLILWFTKANVCCTGIISCISPVDVCYCQHLSFLHHTSTALVPRLFFGPVNAW